MGKHIEIDSLNKISLTNSEKNIIYKKFNLCKDAVMGFIGNIDILLKLGISLESPCGSNKDNPLTTCCKNGSYHFLEKLIKENVNLEYTNKQGQNGLMLASQHGYSKIVSLLLENGANFDTKDKINNNTALMIACRYGHLDCVKILLKNGACLNDIGENGYNSFLMAVQSGNKELVNFLIKKVDINYKTSVCNETALMIASRNNSLKLVELLVLYGADTKIRDKFNNFTAEQISLENNNKTIFEYLKKIRNKKRKRSFDANTSSKRKK